MMSQIARIIPYFVSEQIKESIENKWLQKGSRKKFARESFLEKNYDNFVKKLVISAVESYDPVKWPTCYPYWFMREE